MSENIVKVSDDSFEQDVLSAPGPVLVDFWADWCGPCKMVAPLLEELADEYGGKFTLAKLNVDENPHTPPQYAIRGIPAMLMFKDGKVVDTKVGALPKSELSTFIDQHI